MQVLILSLLFTIFSLYYVLLLKGEQYLIDLMNRVYKKINSIVFRKVADEFILVPIRHNVGDLESIYTLNAVAARIWELINGERTIREIKEKIVEEFEVSPEEAEKDLQEYLQQLVNIEAIR